MTDLEKARKLLPCTCVPKPDTDVDHFGYCVSRYRPIVAAALKAEREQEREACAKVASAHVICDWSKLPRKVVNGRYGRQIAAAIRARGEP